VTWSTETRCHRKTSIRGNVPAAPVASEAETDRGRNEWMKSKLGGSSMGKGSVEKGNMEQA